MENKKEKRKKEQGENNEKTGETKDKKKRAGTENSGEKRRTRGKWAEGEIVGEMKGKR